MSKLISESTHVVPTSPQAALVTKLSEVLERVWGWLNPHFPRPETRRNVKDFLRALLGRVEHKNSWGLSEEAGRSTPYAFQYLLGRARWEADEVRDAVQVDVLRQLGPKGDLILDETGFLKQGGSSSACPRPRSFRGRGSKADRPPRFQQ